MKIALLLLPKSGYRQENLIIFENCLGHDDLSKRNGFPIRSIVDEVYSLNSLGQTVRTVSRTNIDYREQFIKKSEMAFIAVLII